MSLHDLYYSLGGPPLKNRAGAPKTVSYDINAEEGEDPKVEALIDEAGREAVFARARALGWGDQIPPKWVWIVLAHEVLALRKDGHTA